MDPSPEQSVDLVAPSNKEEMTDFVQLAPLERGHERIAKQSVNIPVPPSKEEMMDVIQVPPQESMRDRFVQQVWGFLVPQNTPGQNVSIPNNRQ